MDNAYYGQLNVFHAIAQEGSISAAARKLGIAVPSASQSLRLLEQKAGVPLFHRTTRNIRLTDEGRQLLARTKDAVQTLQQAFDEIRDYGKAPSGTVRITLSRFAYQLLLAPFLADFHARYPDIQLEISLSDGMVSLVEDGFDLGIRFGNRLEEGMVARRLIKPFKEGLYISKSYAERHGTPRSPADLPRHRLIGYRFISANRIEPLVIDIDGQETALDMPAPLMCNDPEIIADATRQGLGIGRIFEVNMHRFADKDDFIPVLKRHWRQYPPVYLYYLKQRERTRKVQAVIDFLTAQAKAAGYLD